MNEGDKIIFKAEDGRETYGRVIKKVDYDALVETIDGDSPIKSTVHKIHNEDFVRLA